jgi:hypothetical protein
MSSSPNLKVKLGFKPRFPPSEINCADTAFVVISIKLGSTDLSNCWMDGEFRMAIACPCIAANLVR